MINNYINLDEHVEYVIYGAASGGVKIANKVITKNGKEVKAYIDKNALEIKSIEGIPVYTIEEFSTKCTNKENTVIVVTLKNIFLHSEIALKLLEEGFCGLIYQPLSVLHNCADEIENKIAQLHSAFLMELRFPEGEMLPKSDSVKTMIFRDRFLVSEEKDEVLCYLPIELLFNQTVRPAYADMSMPAMFPYIDFYKNLLFCVSEEERVLAEDAFITYSCEYLKRQNMLLTSGKREQLLSTRRNIFKEMERNIDIDSTFFERTAPKVRLEKGGHFNLISSGKNKISYQIAKGRKHVPVHMSKEDYDKWINVKVLQKFITYLSENKAIKLLAPIPHPKLTDIDVLVPNYSVLVLSEIGRNVMKQIYGASMMEYQDMRVVDVHTLQEEKEQYSVGCYMDDAGVLYRYLCELGIRAYRCKECSRLELLIDELLGFKKAEYDNDEIRFRMVIIDGRAERENLIKLMSRVISIMYLFEWEKADITRLDVINEGFHIRKKIFSAVWDGKVVNLLEFEKQE